MIGDRKLDGLLRSLADLNTKAAELRGGKRYVDMTEDEKRAYNAAVFALQRTRDIPSRDECRRSGNMNEDELLEATGLFEFVEEPTGSDQNGVRHPDVEVELVGTDGNAFAVLGKVSKALTRAGYGDEVEAFTAEATAGDYDDLLATAMRWVDVR